MLIGSEPFVFMHLSEAATGGFLDFLFRVPFSLVFSFSSFLISVLFC